MAEKKINDALLLSIIEQGKTQTAIAATFGCAVALVCRRLKKLKRLNAPVPPSFEVLTPKEQKFALCKAKGMTNTASALACCINYYIC